VIVIAPEPAPPFPVTFEAPRWQNPASPRAGFCFAERGIRPLCQAKMAARGFRQGLRMPIYHLLQGEAFQPEHIQAMSTAFEEALSKLV
jgi:hypothetical protein